MFYGLECDRTRMELFIGFGNDFAVYLECLDGFKGIYHFRTKAYMFMYIEIKFNNGFLCRLLEKVTKKPIFFLKNV